jgi:hypothetical protein
MILILNSIDYNCLCRLPFQPAQYLIHSFTHSHTQTHSLTTKQSTFTHNFTLTGSYFHYAEGFEKAEAIDISPGKDFEASGDAMSQMMAQMKAGMPSDPMCKCLFIFAFSHCVPNRSRLFRINSGSIPQRLQINSVAISNRLRVDCVANACRFRSDSASAPH